jgi:hypothetical protein
MSELLKRVMQEIIDHCKRQQTGLEQMEFLLLVDDRKRVRIKNAFELLTKIEELMSPKKAHSSMTVFDKKEEHAVVGIRICDDGLWHLEKLHE